MPRVLRYAATIFLFGALVAGGVGGAGAAVGSDVAASPAARAGAVILMDEPCRHRYEAHLAKLARQDNSL
jgi:hypothetical protein